MLDSKHTRISQQFTHCCVPGTAKNKVSLKNPDNEPFNLLTSYPLVDELE